MNTSSLATQAPTTVPESLTPGLDRGDPGAFDPVNGPGREAFRRNPFPYYQWMRENGHPVIRLRALRNQAGQDTVWVLGHESVQTVTSQPELYCRQKKVNPNPYLPSAAGLLNMDPPAYPAMRAAVQPLFDQSCTQHGSAIAQIVRRAFEVFCAAAQERAIDWVSGFCMPVSEQVFYTVYGVPLADALAQATEIKHAVAQTTLAGDTPSLLPLGQITGGLARPPGSVLAGLMALPTFQPGNRGEQLSHAASLALGGFVTIRWFLGLLAYRLFEQEGSAWQQLRRCPQVSDAAAVAELLRYDAPIPMVKRYPHQAGSLGNVPLAVDDTLMVIYASASRDTVLCGPGGECLDFNRHGVGVGWAFGGDGMHHCVGSGLMQSVGEQVLHLLRHAPLSPRLSPSDQTVEWGEGGMFRPIRRLTLQV